MESSTLHRKPIAPSSVLSTACAFVLVTAKAVLFAAGASAQQPQVPDASEAIEHRVLSGQALDWDAAVLAHVPPDPLFHRDPLSPVLSPLDAQLKRLDEAERLSFSASYTLLNQYATAVPEGVRHDWGTGRFDLNGSWKAWDHGGSAGSFSLLVRSGTNLGVSEQFNLSDRIGSALYLNCLPGGGPQQPISLNILYYRQDFWQKKMAFYIGKLHPNEFVSLSMYNNDERTQFLNGENDGNLTISADGVYAGGAALEYQVTQRVFVHAVTVDTEGSQQTGIKTLVDRKYMNAIEVEWKEGAPTRQNHVFRAAVWRDDTARRGSGHGVGFAEDWEFANGWVSFARLGLATDKGTSIRRVISLGAANIRPFNRRGDMFGAAIDVTQPSDGSGGLHHETLFETFYRVRFTRTFELGPDLEIDVHPTDAKMAYSTALLGARARIIF